MSSYYSGCVELCRNTLYKVFYNKSKGIKYDATKTLVEEVITNNKNILDGESLYCDFLINSYEKIICSDQLQRIYGLRNELANYDERLEQQKEQLISNFSIKLGKIGLQASLLGSLVGVFVSFGLSQCSSDELQERVSDIKSEINQIQVKDSLSQQTIILIKEQQDSILNLLNRRKSTKNR